MNLERELVTIRKVSKIEPIANADNIELAIVDGWQCVVKKGEFQVGDEGIYFEIDSFIPFKDPIFEFLRKNAITWRGVEGVRIKTIKLRGQISQGLLLPITCIPPTTRRDPESLAWYFGVEKWERDGPIQEIRYDSWIDNIIRFFTPNKYRPAVFKFIYGFILPPKKLKAKGSFPDFIPKTDEERIQNIINKKLGCEDEYEVTGKLNGSSMTVYVKDGRFGFCSRNVKLGLEGGSRFAEVVKKYSLHEVLPKFLIDRNIAIQGELCGPGIQANYEELYELEFFVFRIYDIDAKRYYNPEEKHKFLRELWEYGIHLYSVPLVGRYMLSKFANIQDYLDFAEGPSINVKKREGVVFQRIDGGDSFKVIANSYLLKGGD